MRGTILPVLMVLIGVALIVRTLVAGAGGVAVGLVLGVLFILAGAGRLYVERKL
jgi:hypothetical protein